MSFSVTRVNGQVVLSLQNTENHQSGDVGVVNGDAKISVGNTGSDTDETVLQLGQTDAAGVLEFEAHNSKHNLEFYGQNIDAEVTKSEDAPYNISWKANNSKFDSSLAKTAVMFEGSEESYNNLIKLGYAEDSQLGKYDNVVVDSGTNNMYVSKGDTTTRFETTANSKGAIADMGDGGNEFYIGGEQGTFVGGKGNDVFTTLKDTAYKNLMLGKEGSDIINDYGYSSLFLGGEGYDIGNMHGKYGIANLGFNEDGGAYFGDGSYASAIFTGETQTDAQGNTYDYNHLLKFNGWTLDQYLEESNISSNPYYNLIRQDIEETLG